MELYRDENIQAIISAIELDEFDDAFSQDQKDESVLEECFIGFCEEFMVQKGYILEVGCGSGGLFSRLPITHAVEPAKTRFEQARDHSDVEVHRAVAECLPFTDSQFSNILHLRGFHQVRSDYEALMEYNRVLSIGGRFVFQFEIDDRGDILVGRVYGPRNMLRMLGLFGFELVARLKVDVWRGHFQTSLPTQLMCVEKVREFIPKYLNQPQVLHSHEGLYRLVNFDLEGREARFL